MPLSKGMSHSALIPFSIERIVDKKKSSDSDKMDQKLPLMWRKFLAEFLGTFFLVFIGDGAIAQAKAKPEPTFVTIALGYGLALMIGILVSGGVSGGHLNPAVSLAMSAFGKLSWKDLPVYMIAQYLGAFVGAGILFSIDMNVIEVLEGGDNRTLETAGIFASYPWPVDQLTTTTLVFDQIIGTMVLIIIIMAVTDEKNMKVQSGLIPLLIGLGLSAIHLALATNAGCAVNPARDLSP